MTQARLLLTELKEMGKVLSHLKERLIHFDITHDELLDVQLTITETLSNAFLHGSKNMESPQVEIEWRINKRCILLKVKDNGPGFNYDPECDLDNYEELSEGGRGLFLLQNILDKVWFNDRGNEIYCLKRWGKKDFALTKENL